MKSRIQFICFQRARPAGATGEMRYNTIIFTVFMSAMLADGISRAAFSANLIRVLLTINDMPSLSSVLGGPRRIRKFFHFYFPPQARRILDPKNIRSRLLYSYQLHGTPSILTLLVLLAYCTLPPTHTISLFWGYRYWGFPV